MKERIESGVERGEAERFAAQIERGVSEAIEGLQELEAYFEMTQSTMLLEPIIRGKEEEAEPVVIELPAGCPSVPVFLLKAA